MRIPAAAVATADVEVLVAPLERDEIAEVLLAGADVIPVHRAVARAEVGDAHGEVAEQVDAQRPELERRVRLGGRRRSGRADGLRLSREHPRAGRDALGDQLAGELSAVLGADARVGGEDQPLPADLLGERDLGGLRQIPDQTLGAGAVRRIEVEVRGADRERDRGAYVDQHTGWRRSAGLWPLVELDQDALNQAALLGGGDVEHVRARRVAVEFQRTPGPKDHLDTGRLPLRGPRVTQQGEVGELLVEVDARGIPG